MYKLYYISWLQCTYPGYNGHVFTYPGYYVQLYVHILASMHVHNYVHILATKYLSQVLLPVPIRTHLTHCLFLPCYCRRALCCNIEACFLRSPCHLLKNWKLLPSQISKWATTCKLGDIADTIISPCSMCVVSGKSSLVANKCTKRKTLLRQNGFHFNEHWPSKVRVY